MTSPHKLDPAHQDPPPPLTHKNFGLLCSLKLLWGNFSRKFFITFTHHLMTRCPFTLARTPSTSLVERRHGIFHTATAQALTHKRPLTTALITPRQTTPRQHHQYQQHRSSTTSTNTTEHHQNYTSSNDITKPASPANTTQHRQHYIHTTNTIAATTTAAL